MRNETEDIQLSEVNVLVGPNNVGKSQMLKEVNALMESRYGLQKIIDGIEYNKPDTLNELMEGVYYQEDGDRLTLSGVGVEASTSGWQNWKENYDEIDVDNILSTIARAKVLLVDAQSRLDIATSKRVGKNSRQSPDSVLEVFYYHDKKYIEELRELFKQTFGKDILLDYSDHGELVLRTGSELGQLPEHPTDLAEFIEQQATKPLDEEGDGFISFVGIACSVLISKGKLVLLDEPDAFLHPPQARTLGRWIGERFRQGSGQVIIATHDSNFLTGLLDTEADINIYRLNRPAGPTSFTHLSSRLTNELANDPLLSSQRVLQTIFHKGAIVCEGGTDRAVYRSVGVNEFDEQDIIFVDALGKQAIKNITRPLTEAGIPVVAIVDFDILRNRGQFKQLLKSFSRMGPEIIQELMTLHDEIKNTREQEEIDWKDGVKDLTEEKIEDGHELVYRLQDHGIFVVPDGELESWMDLDLGSQSWELSALEKIHQGDCDQELVKFIQTTISHIESEYQKTSNNSTISGSQF